MLAFVSSPAFVEHQLTPALLDRGGGHPARPDRSRAVHSAVREAGMIHSPNPFPDFTANFNLAPDGPEMIDLEPDAPADDAVLRRVHPPEYIRFIGDIA